MRVGVCTVRTAWSIVIVMFAVSGTNTPFTFTRLYFSWWHIRQSIRSNSAADGVAEGIAPRPTWQLPHPPQFPVMLMQ